MKRTLHRIIRTLIWLSFIIVFTIGAFEIIYRIASKSDLFGLDYKSLYSESGLNEGGFLKPNLNTLVIDGYGGEVKWITNSKGFRNDRVFTFEKPPKTFRILSIGDSFTAGYRVGQDETFSYLLETQLNRDQDSIVYEVMIACIEDPVHGIDYLNKYGLKYNPDVVILGITLGNDLTQTFINLHEYGRNQLVDTEVIESENFNEEKLSAVLDEKFPVGAIDYSFDVDDYIDKLISIRVLKSWFTNEHKGESIFASRGKSNPFLHDLSHGLGLFLSPQPESIHETYKQFEKTLKVYRDLCANYGFELKVCLFPQRFQVNEMDLAKTLSDYDADSTFFDWQLPNDIIANYCKHLKIDLIDPTNSMKDQNSLLYLPNGDMHWNKEGNKIISEVIFRNLITKKDSDQDLQSTED